MLDPVTVPVPVPAFVTLRVALAGLVSNVAVTARAAVIETVQVAELPAHAPPQPTNVEPVVAAAVNVTVAPLAYVALHVAPQSTPTPETVPLPEPAFVTVSVYSVPGPVAPTAIAVSLGLSGPPARVSWMTTCPLALAVVSNVRETAFAVPPAAA
jgi:hypothetical protein